MPEDLAAALQRGLADSGTLVLALPAWSSEVAPRNVALIVAGANAPVAAAVGLRRTTAVPILLLSRQGSSERAAALDAGADACLDRAEPVTFVVAQARALLRRRDRQEEPSDERLIIGGLTLDPAAREASAAGLAIRLAPREFDLLSYLAGRPGRALRRDEILAAVWGPRYVGATNTVDVHIAWLRQKLAEDSGVRITTLRGVGYRFDVLRAAVAG